MLIKNSGALWYWGVYMSTMAIYLQMYMYLHCSVYLYIDILRTTVFIYLLFIYILFIRGKKDLYAQLNL